ncbi:hypothetical protein BDN70DRAFT_926989 [Pholiota conissans]|uniref:Fungal-type protein kinase domain-containing protein n=1 Tax=Pholiota conissans TaxID=109636 RepID=A0A9P5ZDZ4_9AGAR|nr:hypothetical protein BDN70DRAFT_926989 [Pholiota conissans]
MTPTHARFHRWDRAGVVVSQASNYKKDPGFLCEFLWRFSHLSHEQRGGDMSVVVATKDEERIFKHAIEAHVRTTWCPTTGYYAGRTSSPASLASRGTGGHWAIRVKDQRVHFLKDAWRTDVDGVEIEGRTLKKLGAKKVRNIPTILCWSDAVPVSSKSTINGREINIHCTQTFDWNLHDPERKMVRLTRRVHYRQVTEEAGHTLEQLAGTYELLRGAHHVFQGPEEDIFPSTAVSFHHTSGLQASAPATSVSDGNLLKRGHGPVDRQSAEHFSKRKKVDEESEEVTAAAVCQITVESGS